MTDSIPIRSTYYRTDTTGFPIRVTVKGVLRLIEQHLTLEYEEDWLDPDDFVRRHGEPRQIDLPVDQVASLDVKRRWFRAPRIVLEVHSIAAIKDVPGRDGTRCTFAVARGTAADARAFATELLGRVTDAELRRLESG